MGVIEESLRIKDYKQAIKYIKLGEKLDKKNIELYLYYKGLVYAFRKKYTEALKILTKLPKKQLSEFESIIDINIGICYLALGKLNKTFEYMINNIKKYPNVKFVFIRSHHCFDVELFSIARKMYSDLHSRLLPTK
jgi:tetratricopeptide (TPR) repeat protein